MSETGFVLPSFAKINLFLKVGNRRPDGFHELCTLFQTVSLRDTIAFEHSDALTLESSDPGLPTGPGNLVIRAAEELRRRAGISAGARIRIEKRIPFPGGLGGGSSNAAVALLGLSALWDVRPSNEELREIGAGIGSDVPFFFLGGAVAGSGTGTTLSPLPDAAKRLLLIATPEADYSTADAYNALGRSGLTSGEAETTLIVCRELADKLISGLAEPFNDFEPVVAELAPRTAETRRLMAGLGAEATALSGSGPSVFGIFENEARRRDALERLRDEQRHRVFAVETVTREEYREALGVCADLLPSGFS